MNNLVLVNIADSDSTTGLYKNGQLLLSADPQTGIDKKTIAHLAHKLSSIDESMLRMVDFKPQKDDWTWMDVCLSLTESGDLGETDLTQLDVWKRLYADGKVSEEYSAWLKRKKQKDQDESERRETHDALVSVMGEEAVSRIDDGEDADAYEATIVFSANQRLVYNASFMVPGDCTESDLEQIADKMNPDGSLYEMDEEYWEENDPFIVD